MVPSMSATIGWPCLSHLTVRAGNRHSDHAHAQQGINGAPDVAHVMLRHTRNIQKSRGGGIHHSRVNPYQVAHQYSLSSANPTRAVEGMIRAASSSIAAQMNGTLELWSCKIMLAPVLSGRCLQLVISFSLVHAESTNQMRLQPPPVLCQ